VNWQTIRPWLGTVIRLFLGAIFLWASLAKLHSPRTFLLTVRAYDATPEWLSKGIAYGLPVLEFCVAIVLIVGVMTRIVASVSVLLFLVFLIGLIEASARGIQLECGCFGGGGATAGSTSYTLDILRDIGLLILAAYLVVWSFTRISVEEYLARHDGVEMPSAKRMRDPKARRRYEAQLAAARAAARNRRLYVDGSLALIVVLICLIGLGVQAQRARIQGSLTASHASVSDGVVYGKKAAATVDVYEDFGCPHCEEFEGSVAKKLDKAVQANLAQVRFHTMSILDGNSPNQYSTRAANAALCASDVSVDDFVAFHNLLFGKTKSGKQVQPTEGTAGPSDVRLIAFGKQIGMTSTQQSTFGSCVTTLQHKALVEAITNNASEHGVSGTPTVKVDGKKLSTNDWAHLDAAIKAADKNGPAPDPSTTPSPSTSPSTSPSASSSGSGSSTPSASPGSSASS